MKILKRVTPFGSRVYELVYRIIPDMDASSQIRGEILEIGLKCCDEFEVETAWVGCWELVRLGKAYTRTLYQNDFTPGIRASVVGETVS